MKTVDQRIALQERIVLLQTRQAEELEDLKRQFLITEESLKPYNLVKSTLNDVPFSAIGKGILNGIVGLSTGYIAQKTVFGIPLNPIQNILKSAFRFFTKKRNP
jgi:hypothetical protein